MIAVKVRGMSNDLATGTGVAPRLPAPLQRALKIRVAALEEEQAADIGEFDRLYVA